MIYRIVRVTRNGKPLTRAEVVLNRIEAVNEASALAGYRAMVARAYPVHDLVAIPQEQGARHD